MKPVINLAEKSYLGQSLPAYPHMANRRAWLLKFALLALRSTAITQTVGIAFELLCFAANGVGVEDESMGAVFLQQNHP